MGKQKRLILLVGIVILILGGLYWWKTNQISPITPNGSDYITVTGQLTSSDITPMFRDGDGIFKIKADNGKNFEVHLTSGESSCDRDAIKLPINLNTGSRVEARGRIENNTLRICDPGTYIK